MNNKQAQQVPGMACPQCGKFIPTTITELLTSGYLRCPYCLLKLNIDRHKSATALKALAKVEAAQKRVESTSKFNRETLYNNVVEKNMEKNKRHGR